MSNEHELTDDQQILADMISEISQDCYSAGWLIGIEYQIWERIHSSPSRRCGYRELSQQEIEKLRYLSGMIGGWIYWRDDTANQDLEPHDWGEAFVPLKRWLEMYNKWSEYRSK